MTSDGIDVSHHNDVRDWNAVRNSGNTFVSVKLTQGDGFVDPEAKGYVDGARAAGLAAGGYHFGDNKDSVAANVQAFVRQARKREVFAPGSFLPMLDIEDSSTSNVFWTASTSNPFVADFIAGFRAETGVRKIAVYANLSSWRHMLRPDEWADDDVFIWVARFTSTPGDLNGFQHRRLAFHQYTENGVVPGVVGDVDRNVTLNGFETRDLLIGTSRHGKDDPVTNIPIAVQPDGSFRAAVMAEAGDLSVVVAEAWITFGSTFGETQFRVTALDGDARVMVQRDFTIGNNRSGVLPLPSGCRMATVEGVAKPGAVPAAALVSKFR